jgi:type I restriction enzyme M protein
MVAEYKDIKESMVGEVIEIGEKEELFRVSGKKIEYLTVKKSYNITDPEEQVRVSFYYELIKKYQYPKERIDLEVIVPRREPTDKADIVVYEDDEKKKPYIVVECKKDGISQAEIKQAIEQAFGNANSLRSKYTILVAGNVRIAFDVANFPPEEREKNIIADIPVRYGKVIKFKYKKGDPQWDLREVTRDELLAKFQQCHDALWEGGKRNPAEAFDEMSKLMFCKIHDERFLTKKGEAYQFQIGTHETIKEVAERIKGVYDDAKRRDINVFLEPIKVEDPIIYSVVEVLQGISLWKTELDTKGEAYEQFLGGVFKGTMGQYFTPRPIVKFMVDFLEPTDKDLVIDPACGSGGFLIYTLEKVRNDLEEGLDSKDAEYRWREFALKQVFGIEVNSQLARISMMNMIIHDDGHTNIENNDALDYEDKFDPRRSIKLGRFTLLLTNPPFGASVKEREKSYLANYELGGKVKKRNLQNTETLFIERCLDLLKPGGRMGIVLPDGILTNSSLQYVRDFINERVQILGVVSLPQAAFKRPASKGSGDTGSGVKASLLFLRKKKEGEKLPTDYPIFMAIAEHIGYDATGRPDKDEFPDILKGWEEFRKTNRINFFVNAPLCFAIERGEVEGRLNPRFYSPEYFALIHKLKISKYPIKKLKDIAVRLVDGPFGSQLKVIEYVNDGIPLIRVKDIKNGSIDINGLVYITHAKQEQLKRSRVNPGDVLVTKAGSVGNAAVFPLELKEGNITSHLAKIELNHKEVNPYYLCTYLNSKHGVSQIFRWGYKSTRPELNLEEVGEILIAVPPLEIQEKIASMMEEAYKVKKKKELEAEKHLNSIEEYVSEELGIKVQEMEEKRLRVFGVTARILKGGRLDPFYYEPRFKAIDEALRKGKCELVQFGKIISEISGGATPKAKGKAYLNEEGIPFLRVQNITEDGITLEDVKYINAETHNG